ncbi:MAG: IS66 family insertion sequence element accessory protein TnpA [Scandinavium sp.]|uniref:IS66 family insertion sequence element accessory protein TnpA n=1 Tax=Scandinavium sp. TaxID=2830653 RepID=UPI003F3AB69B
MQKKRLSIEEKKLHIDNWRASGLTRQQYCELNGIQFHAMRKWPLAVAKAGRRINESGSFTGLTPVGSVVEKSPGAVNNPVILFLQDGCRVSCHYTQLTDIYTALKQAGSI